MADTVLEKQSGVVSSSGEPNKREMSTIEFPYSDLADAESIAEAVHSVGGSVEWNTLAGKLGVSPDGGGFRSRMSAARMFGLLNWDRVTVTLTDLGLRICDPEQERAARMEAFLNVPLYSKVYELFSGKTLPPNEGLESLMGNLGVSSKQTERARQAFQRSGKLAGFFDFGAERLVKPAIGKPPGNRDSVPPPPPSREQKLNRGDGLGYDPLIEGLLQRLPPPETEWSTDARRKWLQAAANIFDMMYTDKEGGNVIFIQCKTENSKREDN